MIAATAVTLGATGGVLVATAGANGASSPGCGAHVTTNVTLTSDIGPCPPNTDGIVIAANGITVNLNGHRIVGTDTTNATKQEQVGVRFLNVYNSTVQGPGEVTQFDAGVFIDGGGNDTVTGVTADANIAHVLLTGGVNPSDPEATPCNLGDGITTNNSSGNTISDSSATNNGPYSGISLVGASTNNTVSGNDSYNNDVSNILSGTTTSGPCGPFGASKVGQGRPHQDIGIRIEGPGATGNVLDGNTSTGNQLEGISIHSNVCPKSGPKVPQGTPPNTNNMVENNTVSGNGFADDTDGIAILEQGPAGVVCPATNNSIANNTSNSNARDGVFVGGRGASGNVVTGNTTDSNGKDGVELNGGSFSGVLGMALSGATGDTVSGNTANGNAKYGIALDGPTGTGTTAAPGAIDNTVTGNTASGNVTWDGYDGNPGCDNNTWSMDTFGTVNQACVQ
ncbi:MAG TPA: hypothetical protein VG346_04630 [Acidimicrobiales bacterium]|nr:hypothetical protein [Acidimicrobiales bacterium]